MGNKCTRIQAPETSSENPLLDIYAKSDYDRTTYVPVSYPLTNDDEAIPPLQYDNPNRPPYVIGVHFQFPQSSFKPSENNQDIPCTLVMTAAEFPLNQRVGIDLICAIDISGSMLFDDKLLLVKRTLQFVVTQLRETDRLCIITFDHKTTKLMPLTVMNDWGRAYAITVIGGLKTNGSTNIVEGLRTALTVAAKRNFENYTLDIILLSDGVDDNQFTSVQRARECIASFDQYSMLYNIHTFGYGCDHDAQLLSEIANLKNGAYYYIEEVDDIRNSLTHCVGEILSLVAKDVDVTISAQACPLPFTISKIYSEDGSDHFRLTSVLSGTIKEVVFILTFPPTDSPIDSCVIAPVKAKIGLTMLSTGERKEYTSQLTINVVNDSRRIEIFDNVFVQYERVKVAEAMRQASDMAMDSRFDEATGVVDESINDTKNSEYSGEGLVKVLTRDLEKSKAKLKDQMSWDKGGAAYFRYVYHAHWAKRGDKHEFYLNDRQRDIKLLMLAFFNSRLTV
jgi:Mg-chelatase subunit ChlD